tara:strand:+ start:3185 stop:3580 length:396 start_codon:yes stop_codon:yes gene_type:complete
MRKINLIIVHCSDSDINMHDDVSVIRQWHLERGFDDTGYHFYIKRSGKIQFGRKVQKIGAHTKGHNKSSIGVCLGGKYVFTKNQKAALVNLLRTLLHTYDLKPHDILGHNEFNKNKTCPNIEMDEIRRKLL